MPDQLSLRGGTTTEHGSFTGANKEVTVDTTKKTLVVHDGATVGGHPIMRENGSNSALSLGSAAAPSLKFSGDTNTGIYSPGADQVSVATGGSERLRVDAAGQIEAAGLGTAAAPAYSWIGDPNTGIYSPGADQVAISTNGSQRLVVDSSGRLGLGISAPNQQLEVRNPAGATQTLVGIGDANLARILVGYTPSGSPSSNDSAAVTTDNSGNITLSTRSAVANNILFNTSTGTGAAVERARITSDAYFRLASGTGGIQFNGDTAAANALDDYEEGTWTPAVEGGTTAGTGTWNFRSGHYTKIGSIVIARFRVFWSSHTGTGDMRFTGLPFAATQDGTSSADLHNVALAANTVGVLHWQNTSYFVIKQQPVGGGATSVASMDQSGDITGTLVYTVA